MSSLLKIVVLTGVIAIVAGCERRTEDVVVAPPPQVQPEPTYNKF
jgi:hypothetical protein